MEAGCDRVLQPIGKDGWTKRDMQIKFTPDSAPGRQQADHLSADQAPTGAGGAPSNKPEIDIRADIYEFEPFYGMNWDPKQKRWVPESLDPYPARFQEPAQQPRRAPRPTFRSTVGSPVRRKGLSQCRWCRRPPKGWVALTWGLDSDRVECTNEPSASFDEAVKKFYTVPTVIGAGPRPVKNVTDVILDGFERNVTTLTTNQEKKLDPIAP